MTHITQMGVEALVTSLETGEISAREITAAHLDRIRDIDGEVNAFITVNETAEQAAAEVDRKRAAGEPIGALAGVPVAVKDMLVTTDMPTTGASKILEGYRSPFDATVVRRVREAGLIPLGKTNMDEFAMGSTTETSAFGVTRNPWDLERVPGGSGGGSAAAVAACMAPLAFGSDTGGSIRQPAALTGTVGVKPTYGAVSRYGALALASSLDQVGPAARTVTDAAYLHDLIVGHDEHDSTSHQHDWTSMVAAASEGRNEGSLKGLKVGVVNQLGGEGVAPEVHDQLSHTVTALEAQGAEVHILDAPEFDRAAEAYIVLLSAEASSNLAKFDSVRFGLRVQPSEQANVESVMGATRGEGFGAEVKRRLLLGTFALEHGQYDPLFLGAQRVRTLVIRAFERMFSQVDVIVSATSPVTAQPLGSRGEHPVQEHRADMLTTPANLAGIPALSVPVGVTDEHLPVGVQVLAPAFEDARVYRVGAAIEQLVTERNGAPVWQSIPTLGGKANA